MQNSSGKNNTKNHDEHPQSLMGIMQKRTVEQAARKDANISLYQQPSMYISKW